MSCTPLIKWDEATLSPSYLPTPLLPSPSLPSPSLPSPPQHSVVLHSYNAHNEYVRELSAFNALHEEFYSKQIYDMLDELQALQEQVVDGFQTCMQKHAQLNRDKVMQNIPNRLLSLILNLHVISLSS